MKLISTYSGMVFRNAQRRRGPTKLDAHIPQDEVVRLYNKLAGIYDIWGMLAESRARKRAVALAAIGDGQTYLEVAVGTGLAFREIVMRNPNGVNIGIDLSKGMLAKASQRLKKIKGAHYELKIGNASHLPVGDESVDVLMNNYMFDLISFAGMDPILAEFRRVLKKDGKLVMVNMTEAQNVFAKIYELIYRLCPKAIGACRCVCLSDRLKQHGFNIECREYCQQMLFPSEIIRAYKY
jgi:ubiquinone/menaquinone biosynthesis C-methylase UbiE